MQGLILETPEVVPFRLTQNLVDGFGVSGYEGVFRKSCEITLQVGMPPHIEYVSTVLLVS